jgi:RNA polymerase sigma-70 factor (ECF subfamily)
MDDLTRLALDAGRGDQVALAAFVRRTQPEVWRLCRRLGDVDAADDLTQDTYARAIPALARFEATASARTWLLAIARNTCADAVRRNRRRRRAVPVPDDISPDHALGTDLDALVATLEPDRRAAFVLTQVLGLSYAEAAEVCGVPVGTIRSRVARARDDLVARLREDEVAL